MSLVQAQTLLHQLNQLVGRAAPFIQRSQFLQVVGVHNDLYTGNARELELARSDPNSVHFLPRADAVGLAGGIDGLSILF